MIGISWQTGNSIFPGLLSGGKIYFLGTNSTFDQFEIKISINFLIFVAYLQKDTMNFVENMNFVETFIYLYMISINNKHKRFRSRKKKQVRSTKVPTMRRI